MVEHADVVVVGMGPGGEDVAGRLAEAGLDVVGIDAELVGGECPYWGCVPSKMMIRAANLLTEARRVDGMAGVADVHPDFAPVAARIRAEATDSWDDAVAVARFVDKGGRFVRGWAKLTGPGTVQVADRAFCADRALVIGIGARAVIPAIDGLAGTPYWTNREAIEAQAAPASLIVLGGGAIGVELAQALGRFGTSVTVIEAQDRILALEEPEASDLVRSVLEREGVVVRTATAATAVAHDGSAFGVTTDAGDTISAERLLVAVGRRVDLTALNSTAIGIDDSSRALPVDDHLRVQGVARTWAVGDVTGKGAFTHMSMYQADIVVNDILGREVDAADYRAVPRVTFTDPEVGSVGMTERDARAAGIDVRVGVSDVAASSRGWIHKAGNDGVIKLVEDARAGILVGATSVGPWGGEVLGLLSLAVHARVPVAELRTMIYAYPTFHRAIEVAVRDLADD